MAEKTNANIGFEKQLWDAACVLWGHIPAAEYRKVIIGLIFLRYISAAFDKRYKELVDEGDGFEDDRDAYEMDNVFFVPEDFYENEELIAITKELADTLRKNRTIDWQKRDSARARMRMMIKRLLKKHRYPPEGMDDAVQTVMTQCELWTDNTDMELSKKSSNVYTYSLKPELSKVAEEPVPYGK